MAFGAGKLKTFKMIIGLVLAALSALAAYLVNENATPSDALNEFNKERIEFSTENPENGA